MNLQPPDPPEDTRELGDMLDDALDENRTLRAQLAEKDKKLAEHQVILSDAKSSFPEFAQMLNVLEQDWVRSNSWTTWDEETIVKFRALHKRLHDVETVQLQSQLSASYEKGRRDMNNELAEVKPFVWAMPYAFGHKFGILPENKESIPLIIRPSLMEPKEI
jgi:hypothetical protein